MKFCYIDESGTGSEPFAVMAGVVVDAHRMRPTKAEWDDLLTVLSAMRGRQIAEIHTRDFYAGNGPWRGMEGKQRSVITSAIVDWLAERKHSIVYCAVNKEKFASEFRNDARCEDVGSVWRFLGLHLVLALQKEHQRLDRNKGNTVLIFDNEERERASFTELILEPPAWTDTYYSRTGRQDRLDQIVDAPYFADSTHVPLLQVADFVAFFIRRHVELAQGDSERYEGERQKVANWVSDMLKRSLSSSCIYPRRQRCLCAQLFCDYAPGCLL